MSAGIRMILLPALLIAAPALADVIELKTDQRVAQPALVQEAMRALKGLQSVSQGSISQGGITYRDYAHRVKDAKVIVDRYLLQKPSEPESPGKSAIKDALDFYMFAASVWNARLSMNISGLGTHRMVERCPALRDKLDRSPPPSPAYETGRWRDAGVISGIPAIWSCAGDKIAEAEKLLAGEKK
jgi:hypothetical protein